MTSEQYFVTVTCSAVSLQNGGISYNQSVVNGRYTVDTKATFSCSSGYSRAGSSSSTCQTSGNWSPQIPTCNQSKEFDLINWSISIVIKALNLFSAALFSAHSSISTLNQIRTLVRFRRDFTFFNLQSVCLIVIP